MKKDGFTLIEILISISLVSIVLVSMLNTLVKLKNVYATSNNDTEVRVYGATISRAINTDIIRSKGINTLTECNTVSDSTTSFKKITCGFTLNNGKRRSIVLYVDQNTSSYETGGIGRILTTRSTIEYIDAEKNERLFIKTIFSKELFIIDTSTDERLEVTEKQFYHFEDLITRTKRYPSIQTGKEEVLNVISLKASDPEFDVIIYSGGTYNQA